MTRYRPILAFGIALHLGSFILMILRIEPFYTFFYMFAWWSYILVLSCLNHLWKRNSLIFDRTAEFLCMVCFSVVLWLFFETYNFRLQNWHYLGVPIEPVLRWPGYLLAFGTVLPGIFETEKLLQNLGVFENVKGRGVQVNRPLRIRLVLIGVLMMVAPLISPHLFFPLIWLGIILVLDPILYGKGTANCSFLQQAEKGEYGSLLRAMLAGLICGVVWEFWNYWAGSKWIYTIPIFDFPEVFEMPILGYLGFPFFALECFLLYQVFLIFKAKLRQSRLLLAATVILCACYSALVFYGLDQWTVATFRVVLN
jgi:hypothetical protein